MSVRPRLQFTGPGVGWAMLAVMCLGLLATMGACAHKRAASPGGDMGFSDAEESAAYEGDDAMVFEVTGEAPRESTGVRLEERRFRAGKAERKRAHDFAAPAPAGTAPPDDVGGPATSEPLPEPEPAVAQEPRPHRRQIIYTASMRVAVYDLEEAMDRAESMPESLGGWLHVRSGHRLVLKIPAAALRRAMDQIAALGNVEDRQLAAEDVTSQFVDLESRIRVLRETQNQLIALLKRAGNAKEALEVQRALNQVTMELEQALGQMRVLQDAISFSTLTLQFVERGPHTPLPSSNDPFPWVDDLGVEATEWR